MTAPVCVLCGARDDLAPNPDLDVHWCQDALACGDRAAGLTRTPHRPARPLARDPHQLDGQLDIILDGSPT